MRQPQKRMNSYLSLFYNLFVQQIAKGMPVIDETKSDHIFNWYCARKCEKCCNH